MAGPTCGLARGVIGTENLCAAGDGGIADAGVIQACLPGVGVRAAADDVIGTLKILRFGA